MSGMDAGKIMVATTVRSEIMRQKRFALRGMKHEREAGKENSAFWSECYRVNLALTAVLQVLNKVAPPARHKRGNLSKKGKTE